MPGLLVRLARRHVGRVLARLHHAGDRLHQPGRVGVLERARSELLDEQHGVTARVVGQHRYGLAALAQIAHDLAGPRTVEAAKAQAVGGNRDEAGRDRSTFEDTDVVGAHGRQVNALNAISV
jgi:hypothetical protein